MTENKNKEIETRVKEFEENMESIMGENTSATMKEYVKDTCKFMSKRQYDLYAKIAKYKHPILGYKLTKNETKIILKSFEDLENAYEERNELIFFKDFHQNMVPTLIDCTGSLFIEKFVDLLKENLKAELNTCQININEDNSLKFNTVETIIDTTLQSFF